MKILLADDDRDHVTILRFTLELDGHAIVTAYDGEMALRAFDNEMPNLVILDLNMPKRSGMDVLRQIRYHSQVPVMVLSVLSDEDKIVAALDIGADDYMTKPFSPGELRARTRALLRRNQQLTQSPSRQRTPLVIGTLQLDPQKHKVFMDHRPIHLTRTEFDLLHYLALNRDIVVHETEIVYNVWGYSAEGSDEVVRVTIHRLRRKIEKDPSNPILIVNVPGVGYMFQSSVTILQE